VEALAQTGAVIILSLEENGCKRDYNDLFDRK